MQLYQKMISTEGDNIESVVPTINCIEKAGKEDIFKRSIVLIVNCH